jgi:hypothetical protein
LADIKLDVSSVAGNLSKLAANWANEDLAQALYEEGHKTADLSMQMTPVDTGALKSSHVVSEPLVTPGSISVTIGVGGPAAPYAVAVHEDTDAVHAVGTAKFLEIAVRQRARGFLLSLATKLRTNLAKGRR